MPHLALRQDLFGITSLLDYRKETAAPICELTQLILRGPSTLTEEERELIAAYVSQRNDCEFCSNAHFAAACLLSDDPTAKAMNPIDPYESVYSPKMQSLLGIAGKVQQGGLFVKQEDVDLAKKCGASDIEVHDTVLIAALFCLYNRYVDGLGTQKPHHKDFYQLLGKRITTRGYVMPDKGYNTLTKAY